MLNSYNDDYENGYHAGFAGEDEPNMDMVTDLDEWQDGFNDGKADREAEDADLEKEFPLWGGARPGAGRPEKNPAEKKQRYTVTLSPAAVDALKNLEVCLKAKSRSQVIEYLLTETWQKMDRMHPDDRPDLSQS